MEIIQKTRNNLYNINSQIVSLQMIAFKNRSNDVVNQLNECLAEIIKQLDEHLDKEKQ